MIRSKKYRILLLAIQILDVILDKDEDKPSKGFRKRDDKYKPDKSVDTVEVKL